MIQTAPATARGLPRVGVVLGLGSASVPTILAAAARRVSPVFLLDRAQAQAEAMAAQLSPACITTDITGMTDEARAAALGGLGLSGVMTFSEHALPLASGLACALGLPGHNASVLAVLTSKHAQRRALAAAGVQTTRCDLIPRGDRSAPDGFPFPGVLKPVTGAGSLHTVRVDSAGELAAALARMPADADFVLEEFLAGDPDVAGPAFGDYVSVESLHCAGQSRQVCVTGKLPLAPGFRETGMFLPCPLGEEDRRAVLDLETRALRALNVTNGVTHTEIKLTRDGPRIIEVNGRLGGYVPEILRRATGINLVQAALLLSTGQMPALPEPRFDGVTYQAFLVPPAGTAARLQAVAGHEEIARIAGVLQIEMRAEPGAFIDAGDGTQSLLGIVYGHAPDLDGLRAASQQITRQFRAEFRA